ncbi:Uma2 family endonuclease [Selenomonas ruminantium]|uniref:Uma2 family endonuclease n=1 Tax=Selenomonas ruminantium TaxID=971 RepID=UPI0026EFD68C|nr:Uma2 family endonuclease [Selenomonas ruminantium]
MYAIQEDPKIEQIQGREIAMSPASIKHIFIQRNLAGIIWQYLRGKKCQLLLEAEVVFDEENKFIPDLMVVCEPDKIKKNHIEGAPDFIVEVLSPSTRRRDITIKKDIYEKYGVKEYWIISPKDEAIEVYILRNGKYELDNIYHNFDEEDWAALSDTEKAEQQLSLKVSLYDDLEIQVKEIFE